jgi:uncharacterized protein DUF945
MNKKHIFIALALLIAITPIVSPVISGAITKSIFLEQIDNIPSQSGLTINNNSYDQGWFSSQAETELTIDIGHPEFKFINLTINYDITHGPIIRDGDELKLGLAHTNLLTKLNNMPEDAQLILQEVFKDYSVSLTASIGFDKEIKTLLIMPEYKAEFEGVSYDFGGLEISAIGDTEMNKSIGNINVKKSKVKNNEFEILISASNGDFDFYKFNDYLQLGIANFNVPNIDFKSDMFNMKLNGMDFIVETKENSGKVDLYENISIKEIFAPVPINSVSYTFELNQINPIAFNLWNEFSNSMREKSVQVNINSNEGTVEPEVDEAALRNLLNETLQEGLEFNQFIKVAAMGDELILDLDTRYTGLPNGLHILDVEDPSLFIKAVEIDLLVEAGEDAIMTSPVADMALLYVEQGYLKQEDGKLVIHGKLHDGEATINDIPFPINDMISMALSSQDKAQESGLDMGSSN